MVSGVGIDVIDLSDFGRTLERSGERFIQRIYTKGEIEYCRSQPHPAQSFAARFAAKEAAMKALGIAGEEGLSWKDFEIAVSSSGRPTMILHAHAAARSKALRLQTLQISISHSLSTASAVAIAESSTETPRRSQAKNATKLAK
jgi:holo-[acyl-carrier protein] synthase